MDILKTLSAELGVKQSQVEAAVKLLDDGNTVPFIARYRKEVTGGLDDEVLRKLTDRLNYLRNLEARKEEVKGLIDAQEKLTPELIEAIDAAATLTEVDDIYRPYRPKRKTRASVAKERGLEPLAQLIIEERDEYSPSLLEEAEKYVDGEKGVDSASAALA
ncbi:MAG: RNA-binding transcriptional accessory protein, partial [Clostridia bacterium]|nr:RNA-binding transcriptional accessory protein [Clostridia bacterium]